MCSKTITALENIKQEGKVLKKSVESLKAEINKIQIENVNIIQRTRSIKEDIEDFSVEDSRIKEVEDHNNET